MSSQHQRLCEDIQEGIRELEAGRGIELNGDTATEGVARGVEADERKRLSR